MGKRHSSHLVPFSTKVHIKSNRNYLMMISSLKCQRLNRKLQKCCQRLREEADFFPSPSASSPILSPLCNHSRIEEYILLLKHCSRKILYSSSCEKVRFCRVELLSPANSSIRILGFLQNSFLDSASEKTHYLVVFIFDRDAPGFQDFDYVFYRSSS